MKLGQLYMIECPVCRWLSDAVRHAMLDPVLKSHFFTMHAGAWALKNQDARNLYIRDFAVEMTE